MKKSGRLGYSGNFRRRILVQITGVTILQSEHIQGELFMVFQERIWLPLLGRCKRCNTGPTEVG